MNINRNRNVHKPWVQLLERRSSLTWRFEEVSGAAKDGNIVNKPLAARGDDIEGFQTSASIEFNALEGLQKHFSGFGLDKVHKSVSHILLGAQVHRKVHEVETISEPVML